MNIFFNHTNVSQETNGKKNISIKLKGCVQKWQLLKLEKNISLQNFFILL